MSGLRGMMKEVGVTDPTSYVEQMKSFLHGGPVGIIDNGAEQTVLGQAQRVLWKHDQYRDHKFVAYGSNTVQNVTLVLAVSTVIDAKGRAMCTIMVHQAFIADDEKKCETILSQKQLRWNNISVNTNFHEAPGLYEKDWNIGLLFSWTTWFLQLHYPTRKQCRSLPKYVLASHAEYKPEKNFK